MKSTWTRAIVLIAGMLIVGTGCSQDERAFAAARREGTIGGYQRYLGGGPPEPYRTQARDELAQLELNALGTQPTAAQLSGLFETYRDTALGRELATLWAQAEYREEVLRRRERPDEMAAAARAWLGRHASVMPEFVPRVHERVNEAIFARLRRSDANANLFAALLPAVMPTGDEAQLAADLAGVANNIAPNAAMIAAVSSFDLEGMTSTGRRTFQVRMARVIGERIPPNAPASLMRVYLSTFPREMATDSWELVRQRYDDTLAGEVLARPSPGTMRDYLGDPLVQRRREDWTRQLAAYETAIASGEVGELEAFVAANPTHLLLREAREALEARRLVREYEVLRDALAAALGRPSDDPAGVVLDTERRSITADVFMKSIVPVEFDNRIVSGLTLHDSGLLLVHDEAISRASNPEGVLRMQGRDPFRVLRVAADPSRRLALLQIDLAGRTVRGLFQPARLVHSRSLRQGDAVSVVGTFGRSPLMRWTNGLVTSGEGEMYRPGHAQVAAVALERETLYDSAFLFTAQGDAVGVVVERRGDREVRVLGLAETTPFIEGHFTRRAQELSGAGPDAPRLESGTGAAPSPVASSRPPNPAAIMP